MSTSHVDSSVPPTLPGPGTPSKEWAKDTANLLHESTAAADQSGFSAAAPVDQQTDFKKTPSPMLRGDSKVSTASSAAPAVPGAWGGEWVDNTDQSVEGNDQMYNDFKDTLNSVGQQVQDGIANIRQRLGDPNDEKTPLGSATATGAGFATQAQQAVGNLVNTVRSTVSPTSAKPEDNVAGLLPAPGQESTAEAKAFGKTDAPLNGPSSNTLTGGAMFNASPPAGDIHPATSDNSRADVTGQKSTVTSGPSPVDGLPQGITRTNFDTAHTGNYDYTNLPNEEGNTTNPHAGSPQKGYVDQAKEAIGFGGTNIQETGMGYMKSAMEAVGLGGVVAGTALAADESSKRTQPIQSTKTYGDSENFMSQGALAGDGKTSSHGPDEDVQDALAKAEGRPFEDQEAEGVEGPYSTPAAAAAFEQSSGQADTSNHPIQTTTNAFNKSEVATSPAAAIGATPSPPLETRETGETAATENSPAVQTTTNQTDKAAPATSPASAVETRSESQSAAARGTQLENQRAAPSHDDSTSSPSSSTTPASPSSTKASHHRGPSFSQKLKGNMKVFTGKITGNEAKVEEGKALKSATTPTSGADLK